MNEKIDPADVLTTVTDIFGKFQDGRELHLLENHIENGYLVIRFRGQAGDYDGPFGAKIELPHQIGDDIWNAYSEADNPSLYDWCTYGVLFRIHEEYQTGRPEGKGERDGETWWLNVEQ